MHIAWLTDLHLNFLAPPETEAFLERVAAEDPDALLVGGDVGTAQTFPRFLSRMADRLERPIHFVLGNHDFYGGSIAGVRDAAASLAAGSRWLRWLPAEGVIPLTEETGLLGHDSWADGRLGSGEGSNLLLNDYLEIRDFLPLGRRERFRKLNALGDEAAAFFAQHLPVAVARFSTIILLTHVPPFREAAWHEGRISEDDWLPHGSCQAVGEVLEGTLARHPECTLTVLCGHTHGRGEARILENLLVRTGGATYGAPEIQEILVVP